MTQVATFPDAAPAERSLSGHIPALDGIRGIAITLVLVNNLYPGYPDGFVDRLFYIASNAGWVGVDLFFVLSGFLITGILWDTKHREHYFKNFYARRFLRIFPLYYGFLVVWSLFAPRLFPDPARIQSWHDSQLWYWTYLANVRIALHGPGLLEPGSFWSLAVEEQFYLFWPLIVLYADRRRLVKICGTMILAAFAVRLGCRWLDASRQMGEAVYVLTPARMDALAVGALLAILARSRDGLRRLTRWAKPVFPAALLSLAIMFIVRKGLIANDVVVQTAGYSLVALAAGAGLILAVAAQPGTRVAAFVTHPALVAMGRYSYGIYVWHVVSRLSWLWPFVQRPPKVLGYEFPAAIAIWFCLSAVAVLIAVVSWHGYERAFLKLKEHFPYDRRSAPLPRAA
jgi:peptidoglycan/LPS O-acetylase OafA/YrhL